MSNNNKVQVYQPPWAKDGCKEVRVWDAPIQSGSAIGVATWVEYQDRKGGLQTTMKWVKWKS